MNRKISCQDGDEQLQPTRSWRCACPGDLQIQAKEPLQNIVRGNVARSQAELVDSIGHSTQMLVSPNLSQCGTVSPRSAQHYAASLFWCGSGGSAQLMCSCIDVTVELFTHQPQEAASAVASRASERLCKQLMSSLASTLSAVRSLCEAARCNSWDSWCLKVSCDAGAPSSTHATLKTTPQNQNLLIMLLLSRQIRLNCMWIKCMSCTSTACTEKEGPEVTWETDVLALTGLHIPLSQSSKSFPSL